MRSVFVFLCSLVAAQVRSWSAWTPCFLKEERLQRTREEICTEKCSHPVKETSYECEARPVFSAWMRWEPCSVKQGLCQRSRNRLCMQNGLLYAQDSYRFITDYRVVPRNFSSFTDAEKLCGTVNSFEISVFIRFSLLKSRKTPTGWHSTLLIERQLFAVLINVESNIQFQREYLLISKSRILGRGSSSMEFILNLKRDERTR